MAAKFDPKAALLKLKNHFKNGDPNQNKKAANKRRQRRFIFSLVATCLVLAFAFQNCTSRSSSGGFASLGASGFTLNSRAKARNFAAKAATPMTCTVMTTTKAQSKAIPGLVLTSVKHKCTNGTVTTYPISTSFVRNGKIEFSMRAPASIPKK